MQRTTFITSRQYEFFSPKELTMQFGCPQALWPAAIARELLDNSLDATESVDVAPQIAITLEPDSVTVRDNGPGLPASTIKSALDYQVRVSDKMHYVSPTRGQLGNAWKTIFPAAYVATGQKSAVEIVACGTRHVVEVSVDPFTKEPRIRHDKTPLVQNGTTVTVRWPGIAGWKSCHYDSELYQGTVEQILPNLVQDFSCLNPHASFTLAAGGKEWAFAARDTAWHKWRANDPTSAHWYRLEDLRELIAAEIDKERKARQKKPDAPRKTLRDFVGEFDGLARPQYRARVLQEAGLSGKYLSDLEADIDGDMTLVARLLAAMRSVAKPPKPLRLGVLGREHMQAALVAYGVDPETIEHSEYGRVAQIDDNGLPFVIEVGFGITDEGRPRKLVCGLNNSIVFRVPSPNLHTILADCRMDVDEPVAVIVHQSCPRFKFVGHGKGTM
jgi:DNA topoisomerase VI subunit B